MNTLQREEVIFGEVWNERRKQEAKWGVQNHPSLHPQLGRHGFWYMPSETMAKLACESRDRDGTLSWGDIAIEELAEAFDAVGEMSRREELIQTIAVLVAWVENIDRNTEQLQEELTDGT